MKRDYWRGTATVAAVLCAGLGTGLLGHGTPARAQYDGNGEFATSVRNFQHPHLTVVISIDQFRADYIRRMTDLFQPAHPAGGKVGGFRYLMTQGSYFVDARYNHYPTFTGPGHAAILTGGYPDKTGIIANNWWDPTNLSVAYCVDDARQKVVGAAADSKATRWGR